ncbi:hypothetical protein V1478_014253 [Vespula squamosa]|uniref:Uncharacterized protein n=1 Tax=Vespula squamosa TaxID=30214 RepID=A0ABD2A7T1_VESSQ
MEQCYKSGEERGKRFAKEARESLPSVQATRFDGGILNPETISHECHTIALHNCAYNLRKYQPQKIYILWLVPSIVLCRLWIGKQSDKVLTSLTHLNHIEGGGRLYTIAVSERVLSLERFWDFRFRQKTTA